MVQTVDSSASALPNTQQSPSSSPNTANATNRTFEEIIDDYWSNSDRGNALDYLKTLSSDELRTVSREHGFAAPTPNLYGLDIEGSNNLLRHRGETIDENRDGIDQVGEGRIWRFPNSNTPDDVAAAWEAATEDMEPGEAMLMAGVLFMPLPQLEIDPATGRVTNVINPGDPGYQNPMERNGFSYTDTITNKLRSLDDPLNPPTNAEFYFKAKNFYQHLLETFENHGIA